MTQILARSVLALFATTALAAGSASAAPRLQPAVATSADAQPQLILAATHKKKKATAHKASTTHHKKGAASHRKGKGHHAAAAPAADEEAPAGAPGANGKVIDVAAGGGSYKVKKGDTLAKVADKLGVEVAELKKTNKLKGNNIDVGQVLKAPGSESKVYVAARGDTVAGVSKRFGVTEKALREDNGFGRKTASLKSGQHLTLPEGWRDHAEAAPRRTRAPAEESYEPSSGGGRSVTGRLVDVPGPARSYKVRKGDTLEKVADKLDVSVAALKKQNHLKKNAIRPGQVLHAPGGGTVKAYVVGPGDTTYSIARRFDVTIEALRAANGMGRRGTIHTGQKLRLPAGWRDRGPSEGVTPARPSTTYTPPGEPRGPAGPQPYVPPSVTPPTPGITNGPAIAPTQGSMPSDAQISELGRGKFLWPIRGEILSEFGPKAGSGQRNDGLNIQAETGQPVRAAATGDVVYAGDQVPGYGNLVLITHPDGWVTAYAHLSKVEVKMQQKVVQGQEIGQVGSTGGVSEPQVHFEVRYRPSNMDRAKPVDPKLVLPK